MSVDMLDNGTHLSGNSLRLGFKGSEIINSDLEAIWQVEMSVSLDAGGATTAFNLRDSFVGLKNEDLGQLTFGRHDTAFERVHRWTDLFDDQIGDSRNILGFGPGSHGFDNREDNVIKYISPEIKGVTAMGTFKTPEGEPNTESVAGNFTYRNEDLMAGFAIEGHGKGLTGTGGLKSVENEIGLRWYGSYDLEKLKITGIIEHLMDVGGIAGIDRTGKGLGFAYKLVRLSIDIQPALKDL